MSINFKCFICLKTIDEAPFHSGIASITVCYLGRTSSLFDRLLVSKNYTGGGNVSPTDRPCSKKCTLQWPQTRVLPALYFGPARRSSDPTPTHIHVPPICSRLFVGLDLWIFILLFVIQRVFRECRQTDEYFHKRSCTSNPHGLARHSVLLFASSHRHGFNACLPHSFSPSISYFIEWHDMTLRGLQIRSQ